MKEGEECQYKAEGGIFRRHSHCYIEERFFLTTKWLIYMRPVFGSIQILNIVKVLI